MSLAYYRLSNVGIEFGVMSCEVRGYLSEIQRKNCSSQQTDPSRRRRVIGQCGGHTFGIPAIVSCAFHSSALQREERKD